MLPAAVTSFVESPARRAPRHKSRTPFFGHSLHPRFGGVRRTYLGVSRIRFRVSRTHIALVIRFRIRCIALVAPRLAFVALGLWR